jgi:hypothetical protein
MTVAYGLPSNGCRLQYDPEVYEEVFGMSEAQYRAAFMRQL